MESIKQINKKILNFIYSRWFVFIIAVFVGAVSVFPYYLAQYSIGYSYQGMPLLVQDSEGEYLGRVHELQEGNYSIASSVFFEYKDWPSIVPSIGEWIYFIPSYLFGVSVIDINMFFKFLFPTLLFLLIYVFLKDITKNSIFWSVIGGLVVTIGFDLPSVHFLKKLLFDDFNGYVSTWTRPVNPITGMLALSGYLILVYRIFNGQSKKYIFSGLILGLMIGYFFSFVYAGILTVLLILFCFFNKNKDRVFKLIMILVIGALGVLLIIGGEVVSLILGQAIGGLNDPRFQGLFYTRLPLINKTSLVFTIIFLFFTWFTYFYKKEKLWLENWWIFCIALLFTNQIVFNIQIILGWTIWPQHFAQYTNVALSLVLVVTLVRGVVPVFPKLTRFFGWVLLFLLVLLLVKTLPNNQDTLPILLDFQKQAPVMQWLKERDENGCVVFVVQDNTIVLELNRFIPAFTNCDVYNSYHIYQGVPRDRVFHNLLIWLWMKGVTEKELPIFLEKENVWIRAYLFRDWRDMFCCDGDPWIANLGTKEEWNEWYDKEKEKIMKSYSIFLRQDIPSELKKYRLDYVIIDGVSRARNNLDSFKGINLVYSDDRYKVYSFQK